MTRVSGTKGSKKSLRSKPSFLQPRRLSEESKGDHTTDTEVRVHMYASMYVSGEDVVYNGSAACPLTDLKVLGVDLLLSSTFTPAEKL